MSKRRDLIVQPDDGTAPVTAFIGRACVSLYIKQFTFTHRDIQDAVVARFRAGVDVRVMLNPTRTSGDRGNDDAFAVFEAAGVPVRWTNPEFVVTHEKSMVVDEQTALIATFNLTDKNFSKTRDYGVIIENAIAATQIASAFLADWERTPWRPTDDAGLLWSNCTSRPLMCAFIDSAVESLDVQHPKFCDDAVVERIGAAVMRGVNVRVICGGKRGLGKSDVLDTMASLRMLYYVGVKVRKQQNLLLHAKLMIADDRNALVGSINIDRNAFDLQRELATVVHDPQVVEHLCAVFASDWKDADKYDIPEPIPALSDDDDPLGLEQGLADE